MNIEQRPKGISAPDIIPNQIILHSLGNAYSFDGGVEWLRNGELESHCAIRQDGLIVQIMPWTKRAQANYNANGPHSDGTGAISIETDSSIEASEPWTPAQVDAIVELCTYLCKTYNIPAVQCPGPYSPGIGWHIMWGTPGAWTPVAKACPGPARIAQVPGIIARVAANLNGTTNPPTPKDWFDMATKEELNALLAPIRADIAEIKAAVADVPDDVLSQTIKGSTGAKKTVGRRLLEIQQGINKILAKK